VGQPGELESNSKIHGPSQTSWRLSEPNACLFFMGKSANKGGGGLENSPVLLLLLLLLLQHLFVCKYK